VSRAPQPARVSAAAERARLGLPDARDREPGAAEGARFWPASGRTAVDLLEMAQFDAHAREGDDLMVGVAIPGAEGACQTCHHAKVWHKDARWGCEVGCSCAKFARAPREVRA